eukprot:XP_021122673.1 uncharacterized protein LOC110351363 isoform X4 [Anas platyrhynchos]
MRLGSSFSSTVCTKGRAFSRSSGRLPPAAPVTNVQTGQSFLLYLVNPFSSEARKNTLPFVYLTDANATPLLRELRISLGWTEIIKKLPYLRCRSPGEKGQTSDSAPYRLLYSQLPCSLATTVTK